MANITNTEQNIELAINFYKSELFDYNSERDTEECWIPFTLSVILPQRTMTINKTATATMTVYEINKLISGFESILQNLQQQKETIFKFYSTEAFFELKLETVPEDDVIEIGTWINVGNQTNGRLYGYDEGIRFISEERSIIQFLTDIRQEFADILQN